MPDLAVSFAKFGPGPEVATLQTTQMADPGPGQIRVRLAFAPVNPADLNYLEGTYGLRPTLPSPVGMEGAGTIESVGEGCTLSPGQKVCLRGGPGAWATRLLLREEEVWPLPPEIDLQQAAMLRINPATAWLLLHQKGEPAAGDWILQNGASSAVGHCLVQLARLLGLKTASLVRREASRAALEALGADLVLLDQDESLAALQELTPRPRLACNTVGGASALRLMNGLGAGGTLLTYGAMARQPLKVPNGLLLFQGLALEGFWLTRWRESVTQQAEAALYQRLAGWMAEGRLKMPIDSLFRLSDVQAALRRASESGRDGKVLLQLAAS
ncbi:MAG: 2-enoyl thioester reductase domain-containing protein [Verrucomicrobiota bacterium]